LDPAPALPAFHPLADRLVVLERSFRSVPEISFAAGRILASDTGWARTLPGSRLSDEAPRLVSRLEKGLEPELDAWIAPICEGFRQFVAGGLDPVRLLGLLEDRRILCILHGGPAGRNALNELVDRAVRDRLSPRSRGPYPGQQLIATRNRADLDLRNGDLGVVASREGRLRAAFPGAGGIRWVDLVLVPELEPAWALTVHKAQGSEFDQVLFVLPEQDTPLLDRPIVYTALTRARRVVRIQGEMDLFSKALVRVPDRPSRLRKVLGLP
jgi:exodeoxyribonuclease V alpha subunit